MMRKKDKEKIQKDLIELIRQKLATEFKDYKSRPVDTIEKLEIIQLTYDESNDDRDKIIVEEALANTRLFVKIDEDGSSSSHNTQLKNDKKIIFSYNSETDQFNLENGEAVKFYEIRLF